MEKLRKIGEGIEYLMRRTTSHADDLQDRLLYLKSLMEEIFADITAEIEGLRAENADLRRTALGERDRVDDMERQAARRIEQLERERDELKDSIRQMNISLERNRDAQEELARKAK